MYINYPVVSFVKTGSNLFIFNTGVVFLMASVCVNSFTITLVVIYKSINIYFIIIMQTIYWFVGLGSQWLCSFLMLVLFHMLSLFSRCLELCQPLTNSCLEHDEQSRIDPVGHSTHCHQTLLSTQPHETHFCSVWPLLVPGMFWQMSSSESSYPCELLVDSGRVLSSPV